MHELSVCQSMLNIVLDQARLHGAKRVSKVNLRIGELRGIVPDSMSFYFDFLTKDTIAQGAELDIEMVPDRRRCRDCGAMADPEEDGVNCPLCRGTDLEIVMGMELQIKDIEIEADGEEASTEAG